MRVRRAGLLMLLTVGMLATSALVAQAATPPPGTAIQLPEVDNAGATIWQVITVGLIPIVGLGMGASGFTKFAKDRIGNAGPVAGIAGGVGVQFVPSLVSGAQKAAPAATGWLEPHASGLLAWWQGFTAQSLVVDPIVLFVVLCATLVLLSRVHQQRQRLA